MRPDCTCSLFSTKLGVIAHDFAHQLFDQLLADHAVFTPFSGSPCELIRKEIKILSVRHSNLMRFNVMRQSAELVGATCAIESLWKMLFLSPHPTVSNRVSSNRSLRCRERFFEGRDKEPKRPSKVPDRRCRDRISLNNPPIRGLFDESREISVRPRMRGGAERTRTPCQAGSSIEPVSVTAPMLQAPSQK
jgi:hypothetical protein